MTVRPDTRRLDSSAILSRYGARQEIIGGEVKYSDRLGIERQVDASSQRLANQETLSPSYKNRDFEMAYTFFEKITRSSTLSKTMAAVVLDVCSVTGYSVTQVTEALIESEGTVSTIRKRATDTMNSIRTPSDQHMIVWDTKNDGKRANRLVSP